jgi:hypothetical protein
VKVQWSNHAEDEATLEREELKEEYPHLFDPHPNLEDEIHLEGRICNTLNFTFEFN